MTTTELEDHDHSRTGIAKRLKDDRKHSYLRDFVYGGIDGAVTTFAVVSGVAGAGLSSGVVIVLGFANLIGDGFSMAAGNYLGVRADQQLLEKARRTEERHIQKYPAGEREEVRQILSRKGFNDDILEQAVDAITSDRERWINTMLQEEYGLALERPAPLPAAGVTLLSFVTIGMLPLLAFVIEYIDASILGDPFAWSTVLTAIAFFCVGAIKSRVVSDRWYWSGLETLIVGSAAASLAYFVGMMLKGTVEGI